MICPDCRGRGWGQDGENKAACSTCEGTGFVFPQWAEWMRDDQVTCTVCGGGRMVAGIQGYEWCPCCSGTGRVWLPHEPPAPELEVDD